MATWPALLGRIKRGGGGYNKAKAVAERAEPLYALGQPFSVYGHSWVIKSRNLIGAPVESRRGEC